MRSENFWADNNLGNRVNIYIDLDLQVFYCFHCIGLHKVKNIKEQQKKFGNSMQKSSLDIIFGNMPCKIHLLLSCYSALG